LITIFFAFAVAANLQKILDNRMLKSLTFALVSIGTIYLSASLQNLSKPFVLETMILKHNENAKPK